MSDGSWRGRTKRRVEPRRGFESRRPLLPQWAKSTALMTHARNGTATCNDSIGFAGRNGADDVRFDINLAEHKHAICREGAEISIVINRGLTATVEISCRSTVGLMTGPLAAPVPAGCRRAGL